MDATEFRVMPHILSTQELVAAVDPAVRTCILTSIVLVAQGIVTQSFEHTVSTFVPGPVLTLKAMLMAFTTQNIKASKSVRQHISRLF